ncbi:Malate/L-lactate dehydrogenase [Aspergillus crustosus]
MISLVFTSSAKQMPLFGGKEILFGISPFAAVPTWRPQFAKGKIPRAARRGESIPHGWALNADGNPTTDADVALNGSMAPIGGLKGSGIALLKDNMSGVRTGAEFGGQVGDQYKDTEPQGVGHSFITIRPDVLLSTDDFKARLDTLVQRAHGVSPAPGFSKVLLPGELEHRLDQQRRNEGIPYADAGEDYVRGDC